MFGMGFFEILVIAVVAVIFLGPEKLPQALVDMAKFFRTIKRTLDDAKASLDKEVNLSKIKEEALAYKESITQGTQNLTKELDLKTLALDDDILETKEEPPKINQPQESTTQNAQIQNQNTESKHEVKFNTQPTKTLNFGENLNKE